MVFRWTPPCWIQAAWCHPPSPTPWARRILTRCVVGCTVRESLVVLYFKVIAALTNVPTVEIPDGLLERGSRSRSKERGRRRSNDHFQARPGDRQENYGGEQEYSKMRRGGLSAIAPKSDFDNDGGRAFMRGRGGRGGLVDAGMRRGRGFSREPPERFKGGWVAGPPGIAISLLQQDADSFYISREGRPGG